MSPWVSAASWRVGLLAVSLALSRVLRTPELGLDRGGLIVAAGLLATSHLFIAVARLRKDHWRPARVRRLLYPELGLGFLVPLAALVAIGRWPSSAPVLGSIAFAFLLVSGFYGSLEKEISRRLAEADLESLTEAMKRLRPNRPFGDPRTVAEMRAGEEEPGLARTLIFFAKPGWRPNLSRFRSAAICALLVGAMWAADAGATVVYRDLEASESAGAPGGGKPGGSAANDHGSRGEGAGRPDAGAAAAASAEGEGSGCATEPQRGAPAWARADLYALYFGGVMLDATAPPGVGIGGCPGRPIVPSSLHGAFVYVVGRGPYGQVRSVAVDSWRFGPAIFLAPAASEVLALIRGGLMPVGGYPRLTGTGEVVPLSTPRGTIVLIGGAGGGPGGPGPAGPLLELPPTVTSAWLGAMGEVEDWLWPTLVRCGAEECVYGLADDRGAPPLLEVTYEKSGGAARRGRYRYLLPETQIGQGELEEKAALAGLAR